MDIYSVAKVGKKDMWVTLEDVKSGMVHLELSWFNLMDDPSLLKMVRISIDGFLLVF